MRLRGYTPVVLKDFDGQTYKSYAKVDEWGEFTAPVYYWANIGRFILLPDGTVKQFSYMKEWKEIK